MTTPIPLSAWEQFGIIVLILLFATAFLGGVWAFIRWILKWLDKITADQRDAWQAFMKDENAKTRSWLENMECGNRKVIGQMTDALEMLIDKIDKHDDKVDDRFDKATELIAKLPAARKPKV
jgi:hypothetical protein